MTRPCVAEDGYPPLPTAALSSVAAPDDTTGDYVERQARLIFEAWVYTIPLSDVDTHLTLTWETVPEWMRVRWRDVAARAALASVGGVDMSMKAPGTAKCRDCGTPVQYHIEYGCPEYVAALGSGTAPTEDRDMDCPDCAPENHLGCEGKGHWRCADHRAVGAGRVTPPDDEETQR